MLFKKPSKKSKKEDKNEPVAPVAPAQPSPTFAQTGISGIESLPESKIEITIKANITPAGGYKVIIYNGGNKEVVISKFCINNFANPLRNSGYGRNFYGSFKRGKETEFEITEVGHDLANRDPILFNFLWHDNCSVLYIDNAGNPFRITKITKS